MNFKMRLKIIFFIILSFSFIGCETTKVKQVQKLENFKQKRNIKVKVNNKYINSRKFNSKSFFGIHPAGLDNYSYAHDLGIGFNRKTEYFIWDWADVDRNGNFKFKIVTPPAPETRKNIKPRPIKYDEQHEMVAKIDDIKILRNICPFRGTFDIKNNQRNKFNSEKEKEIYEKYVEKLAERYDGDDDLGCKLKSPDCYNKGDNEYPTESFIKTLEKNPMRYWQVCNNITDTCSGDDCRNKLFENYAEVQKITYQAIKKSCPECQVLIAGDSEKEMYPPIFEILKGKYIDIIDHHFFGIENDYIKIKTDLEFLKDSLLTNNFDLNRLKFWITETGTYSGSPSEKKLSYQNEQSQARGLIKRYITAFGSAGVEEVFWAWGIKEGFHCNCCQFDYTGLIYNGNKPQQKCDANDTKDLGDGVKKLSYYSLKKLIEKIDGFTEVEKIDDDKNFVYKFIKNGKSVYVAWSEVGGNITFKNINQDFILMTQTVPKYEQGEDVTNYIDAFEYKKILVKDGEAGVYLNEKPIFIEMPLGAVAISKGGKIIKGNNNIGKDNLERLDKKEKNNIKTFIRKRNLNNRCGDGVCDKIERERNICPIDCKLNNQNKNNDIALSKRKKNNIKTFIRKRNLNNRCGDGVCDKIEKERNICPIDCKLNNQNKNNDIANLSNFQKEISIPVDVERIIFNLDKESSSKMTNSEIQNYFTKINNIWSKAGLKFTINSIEDIKIPRKFFPEDKKYPTQIIRRRLITIANHNNLSNKKSSKGILTMAILGKMPGAAGVWIDDVEVLFVTEKGKGGSKTTENIWAHELGHSFTLRHVDPNENPTNLMKTGGDGSSAMAVDLTSKQIDQVRKDAVKFFK